MKLRTLFTPVVAASLFLGCEQPATEEEPAAPAPEAQETPVAVVEEEDAVVTLMPEEPVTDPATAAPSEEIDLPDPVALVNGKPISRDEFETTINEVFSSMGMQPSMLPADQRGIFYRQFVEDLVIDKLINQASESIEVTPQMVDEELAGISQQYGGQERFVEELEANNTSLDEFKDRLVKLIRQRKWMETQTGEERQVTDADVEAFYEENKAEFEMPENVRASHILIRVDEDASDEEVQEKQQQASDLAKRAKDGEDFGDLAREFSEDPSAQQNAGDLNYFTRDRMVPEFAEAAFTQEVDVIGDPVRSPFGWHVIKVTDKKESGLMPLDDVKEDIAQYLTENQQAQEIERVIERLRAEADVEILIPTPEAPAQPDAGDAGYGEGN